VEIWQNCIQSYHPNHLDLGRRMDIAYNEYGDPFRLLFIRGVTGKPAAINGLMNKAPTEPPVPLDRRQWRTCLALGGRCYSYYGHKQTNPKTLLPNETMLVWHREQLAPFYEMVSRIEPWLQDAVPVSHVGMLFSERTRFRYPKYDRQPYIAPMEAITNAFLQRNVPIEFVNALDLADPAKRIARFKLLVLPLTAGLLPEEVACLRKYVEQGGTLLLAGDALRHDGRGRPLEDFALAREMGLSYRGAITAASDLPIDGKSPFGGLPKSMHIKNVVQVWPVAGQTLLSVAGNGSANPLLHLSACGRGKVAYLASLDSLELTARVVDWLAGPPPVRVEGPDGNRVVLTQQPQHQRWILHLLSDGAYTIDVSGAQVPAAKAVDQYPADGWTYRIEPTQDGLRVHVEGHAPNRLLVLQ
jgi:hypothetical protein